jgi:hypothetical protein
MIYGSPTKNIGGGIGSYPVPTQPQTQQPAFPVNYGPLNPPIQPGQPGQPFPYYNNNNAAGFVPPHAPANFGYNPYGFGPNFGVQPQLNTPVYPVQPPYNNQFGAF